jgi:K+-transporting ATPase ATPase C chain
MFQPIRASLVMLVAMTLLTGVFYPALVTGIAQIVFPHQANGSLIVEREQAIGSELIGQQFTQAQYFWGRLSATAPVPYNAAASAGTNFGPLHEGLTAAAKARIDALHVADPAVTGSVPIELITASGSGLDPDISPAAAEFQVHRVAIARKMSEDDVRTFVRQQTQSRMFGILGEPRVNVLKLNLALDRSSQK